MRRMLKEFRDFVARGTLIILVIMSMGSWYILVTKLYESLKIAAESRAARKGFFKHASLNDAAKTLKQGSAFRFIAESGIEANDHHEGALTEHIASSFTELCQRAGDYNTLAEVAREQGDPVHFLAGLIAQK